MARVTFLSEHIGRIMFIRTDSMPAIAGISNKVYDLLFQRSLLSLEIKSADNVSSLLSAEEGVSLFLTPVLREDMLPKAEGMICELKDKKVTLQKVKKWDEAEIVAVRIQVKPLCTGRIKTVERHHLGGGVDVGVERAVRCSIS
ncbi:MAG: DUF473 family protein [Theionarchaea archaeon]|nr:DUF473 family protein [Theionarchaea archaeon]